MANAQPVKGWFTTPGRSGDRTLDQQLTGLYSLFVNCRGKSVLDIGCAEGLISIELARRGAAAIHGLEIIPGHVEIANKLRGDLPCTFEVADANTYQPQRHYDIVIMLAVLHKLRDPSAVCRRFADAARTMVILRLPPLHAPTIVDERSGNKPHHIADVMSECGFNLMGVTSGHLGEWIGMYRRKV